MGSVGMGKKDDLMKRLVDLKLEKRKLVLAGKNTNTLDELIKEIEEQLKEITTEYLIDLNNKFRSILLSTL